MYLIIQYINLLTKNIGIKLFFLFPFCSTSLSTMMMGNGIIPYTYKKRTKKIKRKKKTLDFKILSCFLFSYISNGQKDTPTSEKKSE